MRSTRTIIVVMLLWQVFDHASCNAQELQMQSAITRIAESVELSAAQAGLLAEVRVTEGQVVQKGDVLAIVNDAVLQAKLNRAQVEAAIAAEDAGNDVAIRLAEKSRELATTEYERAIGLNQRIPDSVSQREVNMLRLAREKSLLEIEEAKHQQVLARMTRDLRQADVDIARVELGRAVIMAPMSGMVVHVEKRGGEWVDAGTLVAKLVRIDRVRAEGFIASADAGPQLSGAPAELDISQPNRPPMTYKGKVTFVHPEANPVDGRVRIWADFDNHDNQLRPGLPASVRIRVTQSKQ